MKIAVISDSHGSLLQPGKRRKNILQERIWSCMRKIISVSWCP